MKVEHAREFQKRIPFIQHLRIHTDELDKGRARLSVPVEANLMNSMGNVHGGVIMSLLDVALCTAARTLHPESTGVITINLSVSFIEAGGGEKLYADARVLKDGRSMSFVEGEAKNADGTLVAKATGTVRVMHKESSQRQERK